MVMQGDVVRIMASVPVRSTPCLTMPYIVQDVSSRDFTVVCRQIQAQMYKRFLRTGSTLGTPEGDSVAIASLPTSPSTLTSPKRTFRSFINLALSVASMKDPLIGSATKGLSRVARLEMFHDDIRPTGQVASDDRRH